MKPDTNWTEIAERLRAQLKRVKSTTHIGMKATNRIAEDTLYAQTVTALATAEQMAERGSSPDLSKPINLVPSCYVCKWIKEHGITFSDDMVVTCPVCHAGYGASAPADPSLNVCADCATEERPENWWLIRQSQGITWRVCADCDSIQVDRDGQWLRFEDVLRPESTVTTATVTLPDTAKVADQLIEMWSCPNCKTTNLRWKCEHSPSASLVGYCSVCGKFNKDITVHPFFVPKGAKEPVDDLLEAKSRIGVDGACQYWHNSKEPGWLCGKCGWVCPPPDKSCDREEAPEGVYCPECNYVLSDGRCPKCSPPDEKQFQDTGPIIAVGCSSCGRLADACVCGKAPAEKPPVVCPGGLNDFIDFCERQKTGDTTAEEAAAWSGFLSLFGPHAPDEPCADVCPKCGGQWADYAVTMQPVVVGDETWVTLCSKCGVQKDEPCSHECGCKDFPLRREFSLEHGWIKAIRRWQAEHETKCGVPKGCGASKEPDKPCEHEWGEWYYHGGGFMKRHCKMDRCYESRVRYRKEGE